MIKRSLFTLIALLFSISTAWCQQDSIKKKRNFWMDFGYGFGRRGSAYNFDFNFELRSSWILTLRNEGVNQADPSEVQSCPDKVNSFGVALQVGYLFEVNKLLILFSAGPSVIDLHHDPCLNVPGRHSTAIGLDISAKVLFPWRRFVVGINPFLNINDVKNYYGLTANLGIGRFRTANR